MINIVSQHAHALIVTLRMRCASWRINIVDHDDGLIKPCVLLIASYDNVKIRLDKVSMIIFHDIVYNAIAQKFLQLLYKLSHLQQACICLHYIRIVGSSDQDVQLPEAL